MGREFSGTKLNRRNTSCEDNHNFTDRQPVSYFRDYVNPYPVEVYLPNSGTTRGPFSATRA